MFVALAVLALVAARSANVRPRWWLAASRRRGAGRRQPVPTDRRGDGAVAAALLPGGASNRHVERSSLTCCGDRRLPRHDGAGAPRRPRAARRLQLGRPRRAPALANHPLRFGLHHPRDIPPDRARTRPQAAARRYVIRKAVERKLPQEIFTGLRRELGLSPAEADAVMRAVALEAIGRQPVRYLTSTLRMSVELFFGEDQRLGEVSKRAGEARLHQPAVASSGPGSRTACFTSASRRRRPSRTSSTTPNA